MRRIDARRKKANTLRLWFSARRSKADRALRDSANSFRPSTAFFCALYALVIGRICFAFEAPQIQTIHCAYGDKATAS
jgi:hypothetical protein